MALVEIPGGLWIPSQISYSSAIPGFITSSPISSANQKFAVIFQVPKSGTLDWFEVRQNNNNTVPNPGLTFSFQNLTAGTDEPDGTQLAFRNITTGFGVGNWLVPPGVMTDDGTNTGTKLVVTAGDWLACVIEFTPTYVAGNVSFSNLNVSSTNASIVPGNLFYYQKSFTTSWLAPASNFPILGLKYDDGSYANFPSVIAPISNISQRQFNNTSTPNNSGILFSFPTPITLLGIHFRILQGGGIDSEIRLYDFADTLLRTLFLGGNKQRVNATTNAYLLFSSPIDIAASTNYRLVFTPLSSSNITIYEFSANNASLRTAFPMGQYRQLTTGAPGSWTDDATGYGPDMGLIIGSIGDESGGGGGEHSFTFIG